MKFLLLLLLAPTQIFAQPPGQAKDITGLWKGYISTNEKKLPYELVISSNMDTLSGYSYTTFFVSGKEIVTMKKVTVRWHKQDIIVEDENTLYDNFADETPKKIRQTNTLSLSDKADHLRLTGRFETKAPKPLRRANGDVFLEKKDSPDDAKLMAKLEEMKLAGGLSFSFASVKIIQTDTPSIAAVNNPQSKLPEVVTSSIPEPEIVSIVLTRTNTTIAEPRREKITWQPITKIILPDEIALHKPRKDFSITMPEVISPSIASASKPKPVAATIKPAVPKKEIVQNPPIAIAKTSPPLAVVKAPAAKPQLINIAVAPVIDLAKRKIETIDQFSIEADSLQFTLYDNGEVDGDTVSIIMNGKTIVSRQGLSTVAFTKTIYFTPDMGDSIQLVMYAETLGSIPPNTGLLILNYDKQRREVRFSGDLSNNAAITLRRKKKE